MSVFTSLTSLIGSCFSCLLFLQSPTFVFKFRRSSPTSPPFTLNFRERRTFHVGRCPSRWIFTYTDVSFETSQFISKFFYFIFPTRSHEKHDLRGVTIDGFDQNLLLFQNSFYEGPEWGLVFLPHTSLPYIIFNVDNINFNTLVNLYQLKKFVFSQVENYIKRSDLPLETFYLFRYK